MNHSNAAALPQWRVKLALYLDLIRWNRPAGWLLLLWPTLSALWVAAGGWPGWHLLFVFLLGTILMRSAGCCINDVADRNFDRHVKRTAQRPITSGRISVREALAVGAVLAFLAFDLALTTTLQVILLCFPALAVTMAYPYAKRHVSMPQAVLGVAFSFGIPMAYAAAQGDVPWQAGRLPTQLHLMEELKKIKRVVQKADESAPHEVLLVIDGNTGQNALAQVKAFDEALQLTGLIVTKLDGTAKGGVLCAIAREKPIPVYFIGVGEKLEDLETFDAREFAQALLS